MLGAHLIKSWSSTQASISLSSGAAEFYGVVKASGVALGYQALLKDVGLKLPIRVWTDSTATIGICGRQGLGKLRHVDTQCLWIQQRVRDGSVELCKVRGDENPADLFTKHLTSRDKIHGLLDLFGCRYRGGRSVAAPVLRAGTGTSKGELLKLAEGSTGTIQWQDRVFPKSTDGDGDGPEALPAIEGLLPHLHEDWRERFPVAMACQELTNKDPEEDNSLEERGVAIGTGLGRPYGDTSNNHLLIASQRAGGFTHSPASPMSSSSDEPSCKEACGSRRASASPKHTVSVDAKDSRTLNA